VGTQTEINLDLDSEFNSGIEINKRLKLLTPISFLGPNNLKKNIREIFKKIEKQLVDTN